MAVADDNTFDLEDLLECPVCLEQLDVRSKVLPCQHFFCRRCLERWIETHGELTCPECRVHVNCSIEQLPSNILLNRILERVRHSVKTDSNPTPVNTTNLSHERHRYPLDRNFYPGVKARALYLYKARRVQELSLSNGDVIILHRRVHRNWYQGESRGLQGLVPSNYVQILTTDELATLPKEPPPPRQFAARFEFQRDVDSFGEYLKFQQGDVVELVKQIDDNWALGKLLGQQGLFPLSFTAQVDSVTAPEEVQNNKEKQEHDYVNKQDIEQLENVENVTTEGGACVTSEPVVEIEETVVDEDTHTSLPLVAPVPALPCDCTPAVALAPVPPPVLVASALPDQTSAVVHLSGSESSSDERPVDEEPAPAPPARSNPPVYESLHAMFKLQCVVMDPPPVPPPPVPDPPAPATSRPARPPPPAVPVRRHTPLRRSHAHTHRYSSRHLPRPPSPVSPQSHMLWQPSPLLAHHHRREQPEPVVGPPDITLQLPEHDVISTRRRNKAKRRNITPEVVPSQLEPASASATPTRRGGLLNRLQNLISSGSPPSSGESTPVTSSAVSTTATVATNGVEHMRQRSSAAGYPGPLRRSSSGRSSGTASVRPHSMLSVPSWLPRYRCTIPYPASTEAELELLVGDVVFVSETRDDGWFRGWLQRTGHDGLFPGTFVEPL